MEMGKQLMEFCEEFWVFEKHQRSQGMKEEIKYFAQTYPDRPIRYFKDVKFF